LIENFQSSFDLKISNAITIMIEKVVRINQSLIENGPISRTDNDEMVMMKTDPGLHSGFILCRSRNSSLENHP